MVLCARLSVCARVRAYESACAPACACCHRSLLAELLPFVAWLCGLREPADAASPVTNAHLLAMAIAFGPCVIRWVPSFARPPSLPPPTIAPLPFNNKRASRVPSPRCRTPWRGHCHSRRDSVPGGTSASWCGSHRPRRATCGPLAAGGVGWGGVGWGGVGGWGPLLVRFPSQP